MRETTEIEETEMTEDIEEEMIHVTKTNIEQVDLCRKLVSVVGKLVKRPIVILVLTKVSRDILVKTACTHIFDQISIKSPKNIQIQRSAIAGSFRRIINK